MQTFLIVVQIIVALGMIGLILLQRSEGGGLVQSGGGGGGGMMSTRTTANLLTKLTSIFAAIFMGLCLLQAIIAAQGVGKKSIIAPIAPLTTPVAPVEAPMSSMPVAPASPNVDVKKVPAKKTPVK